MILFSQTQTAAIAVYADASEAVLLAVADLQRDLRRVSGRDGFPLSGDGAIRIEAAAATPESYRITVTEDALTVAGADDLGVIYGIYRICSDFLGIDPLYHFSEIQPQVRQSLTIPPQVITHNGAAVRYRGWFLNDEDLLTDFRVGGQRHIDYKYYQNVMDVSVLEPILEAALRLGLNLIIPGSFIDICNPPERRLVEAACRRGLYVTMHHIEPLGVSHFTAENYFRDHGIEGEPSFVTAPQAMEALWRHYAEAWSAFGRQVIWQFGLRGRGDMPVWASDATIANTDEAHGAIISNAIALQYRIVAETLGRTDFPSTVTLWEEGAALYCGGHLHLPADAGVIFADVGTAQMLEEPLFTAPKRQKQGIYYHVGYIGWGPHLAEGCCDEKQVYNYRTAADHSCTWYSILNVSNLRELHMGARLNAAILQNPADFDLEQYRAETLGRLYGEFAAELIALRRDYFAAIADLGETDAVAYNTKSHTHFLHNYGTLPFAQHIVSDGVAAALGKRWLKGIDVLDADLPRRMAESQRQFSALYDRICAVEPQVPSHLAAHFALFPKLQTHYMAQLLTWNLACRRKDREEALKALKAILQAREIACQGPWQGWYNGEKKIGIRRLLSLTEAL